MLRHLILKSDILVIHKFLPSKNFKRKIYILTNKFIALIRKNCFLSFLQKKSKSVKKMNFRLKISFLPTWIITKPLALISQAVTVNMTVNSPVIPVIQDTLDTLGPTQGLGSAGT